MMSLVDKVMKYEAGMMEPREILEFFGTLIADGTAWSLQGSYGRTARDIIARGYLTDEGQITVAGQMLLDQMEDEG